MQNKKCGPDSRGRISCFISIFVFSLKFRFFGSDGSAILSPDFYSSSNLS